MTEKSLSLFFRLGFLLGQQYDVVDVFAHPLFGIAQGLFVFANSQASLMHALILPVVFVYDVRYGLVGPISIGINAVSITASASEFS